MIRLRYERMKRGMSIFDAADASNIRPYHLIYLIESGKSRIHQQYVVDALERVFAPLTIDELLTPIDPALYRALFNESMNDWTAHR